MTSLLRHQIYVFRELRVVKNVKFQDFSSMLYWPRRVTKIAYYINLLTLKAV